MSDSPALLGLFRFMIKSFLCWALSTSFFSVSWNFWFLFLSPMTAILSDLPLTLNLLFLQQRKKKRLCWCQGLGCTRTEVGLFCISENQWVGWMFFLDLPPLKTCGENPREESRTGISTPSLRTWASCAYSAIKKKRHLGKNLDSLWWILDRSKTVSQIRH